MAGYSQPSGGDIGTLLRQIQEQKSGNPVTLPPGAETAAPLRDTVQTTVLNPESSGSSRNLTLSPEQGATPGQAPSTANGITPRPSVLGFGGRGGAGPTADINMFNIPEQRQGPAPVSTPVEKIPTIPIAPQGAPTPTSFVQTPGLSVGTKIASQPLPVATVPGQNRAETIVSFAQQELDNAGKVLASSGASSQEGQNALDRIQKLQAQLEPLAATAPDYLKQNVATLTNNIGTIRNNAVVQIARDFGQIPDWATPAERQAGQQVIDAINTARTQKAEYDHQQTGVSGNNNGGGGGDNNGPSSGPSGAGQPQSSGSSGSQASSPGLGTRLYPSNFIGPVQNTQAGKILGAERQVNAPVNNPTYTQQQGLQILKDTLNKLGIKI